MIYEREALMRAICENPADDTPRLVFADWLEENGEPERAEFIRVQCRIAEIRRDCGCGECVRLRGGGQHHNGPCGVDRERIENADGTSRQALLRMREWGLFLLIRPQFGIVSRGFVSAVSCRLADWVGGPCPRCQGRGGWEAGPHSEGCCKCDETGRTPALGPRIVAEQPVGKLDIIDLETDDTSRYEPDFFISHWPILPAQVIAEMKTFNSEEEAIAAGNRHLLNWARREAGLPPIPASS